MQGKTGTINYETIKAIEGSVVEYTEGEYQHCKEFAKRCDRPWVYETSNQFAREKRIVQHAFGKLCEVVISKLLSRYGCNKPDFTIGVTAAGWKPDLECGGYKLHAKSVEHDPRYGISFTFQNEENNPYAVLSRTDKLFKNNDISKDIIICSLINQIKKTITIYDVNKWGDVKPQLRFRDGIDKASLKGHKLFYSPVKRKI